MVQVFMLILIIGIGADRKQVEETLYFRSITTCNATAQALVKRFGHWSPINRAEAYCIPSSVTNGTPIVSD